MAKRAETRLREIDDEMTAIEIEKIQVASRIQSAILANDDAARRLENRRLVQLSVRFDQLKSLRQPVAREVKHAEERVQQRKPKSASGDAKAVREEEGNGNFLREGKQVRERKESSVESEFDLQQGSAIHSSSQDAQTEEVV